MSAQDRPALLTDRFELRGEPLDRLDLDEPLAHQIASQVAEAVFGRARTMQASILDQAGLANSIVVRDPDGWSELLVRYFPYSLQGQPGGWRDAIGGVFEFERAAWHRWDRRIAEGRSTGRLHEVAHLRSPWEADRVPCCPTLRIEGQEVPSLVRRYLPWPSVRDAMRSDDRVVELLHLLYAEVLPQVIPEAIQVPVAQAARWLLADDPRLSRDHLLTDGTLIVPTRWRSLCASPTRITLGDFQLDPQANRAPVGSLDRPR